MWFCCPVRSELPRPVFTVGTIVLGTPGFPELPVRLGWPVDVSWDVMSWWGMWSDIEDTSGQNRACSWAPSCPSLLCVHKCGTRAASLLMCPLLLASPCLVPCSAPPPTPTTRATSASQAEVALRDSLVTNCKRQLLVTLGQFKL